MIEVEWNGVLLPRDQFNPEYVQARDRLSDAAKSGNWDAVFEVLDASDSAFVPGANDWRIGGTTWFSPLHQAAWLGAPERVVRGLVDRGGWCTLRDSMGRRPLDIARDRGNDKLLDALAPVVTHPLASEEVAAMNRRLAELIEEATREVVNPSVAIRHLDIAGLAENGASVWFPIPGMAGGFSIELFRGRLHVDSWSRMVGGSGRAYVVTATRTTLVDKGFV